MKKCRGSKLCVCFFCFLTLLQALYYLLYLTLGRLVKVVTIMTILLICKAFLGLSFLAALVWAIILLLKHAEKRNKQYYDSTDQ